MSVRFAEIYPLIYWSIFSIIFRMTCTIRLEGVEGEGEVGGEVEGVEGESEDPSISIRANSACASPTIRRSTRPSACSSPTYPKPSYHIPKDSYLVIANHLGATDFMLINEINTHYFRKAKHAFKSSLMLIPVFYQCCVMAYYLVLHRSIERDRINILNYFNNLKALIPVWFVFFPEGHRITKSRIIESKAYCTKIGITPFKHVLCPRYKGFALIHSSLTNKNNDDKNNDMHKSNMHKNNDKSNMHKNDDMHKNNSNMNNSNMNNSNMHNIDNAINKILDLTIYCRNPPSIIDMIFCRRESYFRCNARIIDINSIKDPKEFLEDAFRRKDRIISQWQE